MEMRGGFFRGSLDQGAFPVTLPSPRGLHGSLLGFGDVRPLPLTVHRLPLRRRRRRLTRSCAARPHGNLGFHSGRPFWVFLDTLLCVILITVQRVFGGLSGAVSGEKHIVGPCVAPIRARPLRLQGDLPAMTSSPLREPARLSPGQLRFWIQSRMFPDSAVCNDGISLRIRGEVDPTLWSAAVRELCQRHDALRTSFHESGASAIMRVAEKSNVVLRRLDWSGDTDVETRFDAWLPKEAARPFDLLRPPLARFTLIKLAAENYVLTAVFHHLVMDGTSFLRIFPQELVAEVERLQGVDAEISPSRSFQAFAADQTALMASDEGRAGIDHWRDRLAALPLPLELATDHARAPIRSLQGQRRKQWLSPEVVAATRQLAERLEAPLSEVLFTAFAAFLAREVDEDDLPIAMPVRNRPAGFENTFGCLMNVLVRRLDLSEDPSFETLVRRALDERALNQPHRRVVLDSLLGELSDTVDPSRSAVYQAIFNFVDFGPRHFSSIGLDFEIDRIDPGVCSVDIAFDLTAVGETLECQVEFNTQVFSPESADRWMRSYETLLGDVAADPSKPLSSFVTLAPTDRESLQAWSGEAADPIPAETLTQLLQTAAPDSAAALVCDDRRTSYGELRRSAGAVANALTRRGIGRGTRVAVSLSDPDRAATALLGVLESGAAFVVIDPSLPASRRREVEEEAQLACVITNSPVREASVAFSLEELILAGEEEPRSDRTPVSPEDTAYLCFTSGSTGKPKAAVLSHRAIASHLRSRERHFAEPPQRMLIPYSLSFDAAYGGLFWTLCSGGTVVFPRIDQRADLQAIRSLIRKERVDVIDMLPSFYERTLEGALPGDFPDLRLALVGAEACLPRLLEIHRRTVPNAKLVNEYGPTETTVASTAHELPSEGLPERIPIGRPFPNASCYVIDATGQLAPPGAVGELWIGGPGVADGYWNRPELSAERFVETELAEGRRAYRTGDQVRWRHDGLLEFLGRDDRQVKIRGHRIEPAEIEEALARLDAVREVAVLPRTDSCGTRELVAFVVARTEPVDAAELKSALVQSLPSYMVPAQFFWQECLPTTSNGKLDRKRLLAGCPKPSSQATVVADFDGSPIEAVICGAFREVLARDSIGQDQDFFDQLGGDSFKAVDLLARLGERFGCILPLQLLIQSPTASMFATALETFLSSREEELLLEIQPGEGRAPLFLFHPLGGHAVFARRIAMHLDPQQPVYGLQARGLDGQHAPLESIEEMAELYIERLRRVEPTGLVHLVGPSLGGQLALEVAQRLHERGQPVGLVGLIDSYGPHYPRRHALWLRLGRRLLRMAKGDFSFRRNAVDGGALPEELENFHGRGVGSALALAVERVARANQLAANRYQARPLPGGVHLFRAKQSPTDEPNVDYTDPHNGWFDVMDSVGLSVIDASHQDIVDEPAVAQVAAEIQALLGNKFERPSYD